MLGTYSSSSLKGSYVATLLKGALWFANREVKYTGKPSRLTINEGCRWLFGSISPIALNNDMCLLAFASYVCLLACLC
jgi:hypothetical protein